MSEQQHVPIEDLAAYAAGDLDAAAAVTVEAHTVLCAECRADVEAVKAATTALNAVPSEPMPDAVAARLDAALATERAPSREPAGTVLPMVKRRRPSWAGVAAVAAGVALVGGLTVPFLTAGRDNDGSPAATSARQQDSALLPESTGTRRLESGLDYTSESLAATLDRALAGVKSPRAAAGGGPVSAPSPSGTAFSAPREASAVRLTALRTQPAHLAACLDAVTAEQPPEGRTPFVVDFATFKGRDALVLVFPAFDKAGKLRANQVDVWVVGPGCGVEPGGDVLDFARIPRPRI
jgi:hypothetical protein